jgi:hypothetical protein
VSREELVAAFLEGRVSRRTLIRRLVAGGVSVGAAVSYAHLLKPERASAVAGAGLDDLYPLVTMSILSADLDTVIINERVRVRVTSTEEINFARFRAFLQRSNGLQGLGRKVFASNFLAGAGTREVVVPVNTFPLKPRERARIRVDLTAFDAENKGGLAVAVKLIER